MDGIDWGTAPAWAAIVVSSLALLFAGAALRRERGRDKARQYAELQSQASKVSTWMEIKDHHAADDHIFVIRNESELPVWQVLLSDPVVDDRSEFRETANVLHGVQVLGAKSTDKSEPIDPKYPSVLALEFSDASGVVWVRTHEQLRLKDDGRQPLQAYPWLTRKHRRWCKKDRKAEA